MDLNEFYSYTLHLEMDGGHDKSLLLPVYGDEDDSFHPHLWLIDRFSNEDCFSYWATKDSGLHVVFPEDFYSASFHRMESAGNYNGIIFYPSMMNKLDEYSEEIILSFPGLGE
jgi:hypothetical protein